MDLSSIIFGSLAYCAVLVVVAYGWAQYMVHVGRCWWLPLPLGLIGLGVLFAWRYVFGMPFESNLLEVALFGILLSLTSFVVLSAIGWWHWAEHRRARHFNLPASPTAATADPAATSPAPPRSAD
jgi:hypothetical protein